MISYRIRGRGGVSVHSALFAPELTTRHRDLHTHPDCMSENLYSACRVIGILKACAVDEVQPVIRKTGIVLSWQLT